MLSIRLKIALVIIFGLGALMLIGGILALTLIPSIINEQVVKRDNLGYVVENGTEVPNDMTVKWLHPPYDMRLHIWMYNITNEQTFLHGGKAQLQQIGPYVFIEDQEKKYHEWIANDTRILYRNNRLYFFNQTLSCEKCLLSDKVVIPNIVFQKLQDAIESLGLPFEIVLKAISGENLLTHTTVGEALFEGYEDPMISKICGIAFLEKLCAALKLPKRIGFFYGQNNTNDGTYEVGTGKDAPWDLGKVYTWQNQTTVPASWWDSEFARMINGTDGQLFPPILQKDRPLEMFAAQACRSVRLEYSRDSEYQGVAAWRYSVPAALYDPALPDNRIFCHPKDTVMYFNDPKVQIPGCLPAGLLDLSACQPGNPRVYLSQAHFLNSPKELWSAVSGLDIPDPRKDSTYVDIEPISGVPIHAKRVMQVNVGLKHGKLNPNVSSVILPVLWVNETASFDAGTRDQLLNELIASRHAAFVSGIALVVVGTLCWLGVLLVCVVDTMVRRQSPDEEHLVAEEHAAVDEDD